PLTGVGCSRGCDGIVLGAKFRRCILANLLAAQYYYGMELAGPLPAESKTTLVAWWFRREVADKKMSF
ncbi:hypothetical protein PISMIDRAFT_680831, partial [Pisolithus microcarpus 441]